MKQINDYIESNLLTDLIKKSLEEDIGSGDATVIALIDKNELSEGKVIAKAEGVVAGLPVFKEVLSTLDPDIDFSVIKEEGEYVYPGDEIIRLKGLSHAMLTGERTSLNFLGLLSGIATESNRLNNIVKGKHLTILDTRKTTPLLRGLEKYAVHIGGCSNHRIGLYDMIMIKENHIRASGNIKNAVDKCRTSFPKLKIEVETTNVDEVKEALDAGADRIMFDNMTNDELKDCVKLVNGKSETEASGNMNDKRIEELADSGIDFISVGSLTHTIKCLDFSMLFETNNS